MIEELRFDLVQKCLIEEDRRCITLVRLVVHEEHRGIGVGTAVLQELKLQARKKGKTLRLVVDPQLDDTGRQRLVRFYRQRGFHLMSDGETMIY